MRAKHPYLPCRLKLSELVVLSCFAGPAAAMPNGAEVVHGNASLQQNGNLLTVTNSAGAAINWQGFSIGQNEAVRFIQPSVSSNVLNRVVGSDPSTLLGWLQSNGRVWLINPAGILVGPGARIDVAGFAASTLAVRNEDFLAGRLLFQATPGAGAVRNQGTIATPNGGQIYLVGTTVENTGVLQAPDGTIALAAGDNVRIGDTATLGVFLEVGNGGSVRNTGRIVADAGRVGLVGALVKNSGVIDASSAVQQGGRVFLRASDKIEQDASGKVDVSGASGGTVRVESGDKALVGGSVDASGKAGDGGQVRILGGKVAVLDNGSINATGATNGGTVLLGGDFQGKNADIRNATFTYFGNGARITADAGQQGNGGKIVVWSNDTTRAFGSISARGGNLGGNGGQVEVSGKQSLLFRATVDTRAPAGATGMLLLDPSEVTIGNTPTADTSSTTNDTDTIFGNGTGNATIDWADINHLLSSSNVTITTDGTGAANGGQITLASGNSYNSGNSFNLFAHGDIDATGVSVSNSGTGALNFTAGWTGQWQGTPGSSLPINATNAGIGSIVIQNSNISTNGDMDWRAGNGIAILGGTGTNLSSTVFAGGTQLLAAPSIDIKAGDGGNDNFASLSAGGDQTINTTHLFIRGGGDSGAFTGNFAKLRVLGSNSLQTVNIAAGGSLDVTAGSGTGLTKSTDTVDVGLCGQCSSENWALLQSTNAQLINFAPGSTTPTLTITGGAAGVGNYAGIAADNGQAIIGQAWINIMGGTSSSDIGDSIATQINSKDIKPILSNLAGIYSASTTLPQYLSAASITLDGGGDAKTAGGAFITGQQQQFIDVSGDVTLKGGASNAPGIGTAAAIYGSDLMLNVGGNLTLAGGAGSNSPAILGNPENGKALITLAGAVIPSGNVLTAPSLTVVRLDPITGQITVDTIDRSTATTPEEPAAMESAPPPPTEETPPPADASPMATEAESPPPADMLEQDSKPAFTAETNLEALAAMITQRHEKRTELYKDALEQLRRNPEAADAPDCNAGMPQGGHDVCVRTDTQSTLTLPAASIVPTTRKRVALLFGNSTYTDKRIAHLSTPIADVKSVAELLRSKFNFETHVVTNATKADFFREMNKLAGNVEQADSVFVMYAGHGYEMKEQNMGFWIPTDAKSDVAKNWVSNTDIGRFLRAIPARQVMLVSDSCFSGSLTKEQRIREMKKQEREQILRQRSVTALSSGGDEPVVDSGAGGHSVFAGKLLKSLGQLKKDVTGFELYRGLYNAVLQEFPQEPQYGGVLSAGHTGAGDYLIDVTSSKGAKQP